MAEEIMDWGRPQMVGDYYEPRRPSLEGIMDMPEPGDILKEVFDGFIAKTVEYSPIWETVRWPE